MNRKLSSYSGHLFPGFAATQQHCPTRSLSAHLWWHVAMLVELTSLDERACTLTVLLDTGTLPSKVSVTFTLSPAVPGGGSPPLAECNGV